MVRDDIAGVAAITGGGGGLGRAVAAALVDAGWRVGLIGRNEATLQAAAAAIGTGAIAAPADVADRLAFTRACDHIAAKFGPATCLVHAAGMARAAPLLPPDDDLWDETMATNARGAWVAATSCLPAMLAAGDGDIVFVASTAALRGYRHTAAYVASKHALLGLARALAADVERKGVRIHVACPGFLDTPLTEASVRNIVAATGQTAAAARAALAAQNASNRLVPPEEVATAICRRLRGRVRDATPFTIE